MLAFWLIQLKKKKNILKKIHIIHNALIQITGCKKVGQSFPISAEMPQRLHWFQNV